MGRESTLRAVRIWPDEEAFDRVDRDLLEAMLQAVGERGYTGATVQHALNRSGVSRACFYRHFANKEDCFLRAYEMAAERLYEDAIAAARVWDSWGEGLRAGLAELLRFVAEQPLIAKALTIEVRTAGEAAWAKHEEVVQRFVSLLDRARSEPGVRHLAPAWTGRFVAGAIEESLHAAIVEGRTETTEELLPGLTHFVMLNYFGEEEAFEAMEAAASPPLAAA